MNTSYFINLAIGNIFGSENTSPIPSTYYVGLSSKTPNINGSGFVEPTSDDYSRVAISSFTTPENGVVKNKHAICFNESNESWGKITHYLVFDSETNGNLLFFGEFLISKTVAPKTVVLIRENEIEIALENK